MTKPRQVRGLKHAEFSAKGPYSNTKLKGRAAEGIRYQRQVQSRLEPLADRGYLLNDQWLRYIDTYGTHFCQPDAFLVTDSRVLVVEAKLSLRRLDTAVVQLTKLYSPVLEHIFEVPVAMVVAFRHWIRCDEPPIETVDDPADLLSWPVARLREPVGWHHLGA